MAHGLAGQGVGQPQSYGLVREQPQRPAFPPSGRGTTGDRDEMGLAFAREPGRCARTRPFHERPEVLFHKALARALDRDSTGRNLLHNFLIGEPFISFQQDAGACHLSSCGLARSDEA